MKKIFYILKYLEIIIKLEVPDKTLFISFIGNNLQDN